MANTTKVAATKFGASEEADPVNGTGDAVPVVEPDDMEPDVMEALPATAPERVEFNGPKEMVPPQGAAGVKEDRQPPKMPPSIPTSDPVCMIISGVKAGVSMVLFFMKPIGCIMARMAAA